jgi:hypothetical protein
VTLVLLMLGGLFAVLAYDAWKLSVPAKDAPYEVTAAPIGSEVDGVSAAEVEGRKGWHLRYGIGDTRGAYWFWGLASAGCVGAALWAL